ncbi:hypothetical protein BY458DRAFT_532906 [Sporodiniella umbellata]|nr:hypothetical protein BY458DRAFT_532906 [Sporodiniella umbellata]
MIQAERLWILAQQLRLEKDREQYNKVISMKHSIESRLEGIYLDTPTDLAQNMNRYSQYNDEDDDDLLDALPTIVHKAVRTDASIIQLITPPASPHSQDSFLNPLPPLVHLQKKSPSLKGFWKRNHRLGPYELIRSDAVPLWPACDGEWINAVEEAKKPKMMLRLTLALPDDSTPNDQRRYGFTFQKIPRHDHVKLALVPDSLVKEALVHWVDQGTHTLPSLTKADKIVRSKKKIYIVYDLLLLLKKT